MTSRERILAAMRCERVDRVPVTPWRTGGLPIDSPLGRELLRETDPLMDVGSASELFFGKVAKIDIEQCGDTTVRTIHTPKGDLTSKYRRTDITGATVEFLLKEPEDVEKLLSIPYEPPDMDLSFYSDMRDRVGDEGLVMAGLMNGVAGPAAWFSPEGFCLAWADCPDLIERFTAVMTERMIEWGIRACKAGVPAFRVLGGEYVTVQLGKEAFRRLCVKYDRELIATLHTHGALAHYHNHGPVMRFLEDFAEIGMDSLDPLEAPPWGDVSDLGEARRRLGDRICMLGNIDDMEVLDKISEMQAVTLAAERLEAAGDIGFMLGGTSSSTFGERGARNFLAIAEMVRVRYEQ